ncbi:HdeD family acid-resistance protein [Flammeovirga pectinis]|uniref:HdeD family acid-resistance protein n=1 Tax=Flammeovirga pectinis TaxID=2494373 RepID=A0A3S9PBM2_9BACT|nr:DUF308 domain-containing protein [Flammeovirga pectinis]AZQ65523.1 HdeD family acid-resistance protein [Flammeovirga pectinis]
MEFSVKHWYLPLISGFLFIALGIWAFMNPLYIWLSLSYIFSLIFLVSGAAKIISAIINRNSILGWGWTLTDGIFTTLFGSILLSAPFLSVSTLPLYLGFYVTFKGFDTVAKAIEYKDFSSYWSWILFSGIISIVFGFCLLGNILLAGMTVALITSLSLINTGLSEFFIALKLKKLNMKFPSKG